MGEQADYYVNRTLDRALNPERLFRQRRAKGSKCPSCGSQPKECMTQYGVKRECCGLWGWGDGSPLVDRETHAARSYAHRVFDSLWQSGLVSRSQAYALLAQELDLHPNACHMRLMDKETAQRVPAAAHAIGKRLKGDPT